MKLTYTDDTPEAGSASVGGACRHCVATAVPENQRSVSELASLSPTCRTMSHPCLRLQLMAEWAAFPACPLSCEGQDMC